LDEICVSSHYRSRLLQELRLGGLGSGGGAVCGGGGRLGALKKSTAGKPTQQKKRHPQVPFSQAPQRRSFQPQALAFTFKRQACSSGSV
jgi:hypothetical protein